MATATGGEPMRSRRALGLFDIFCIGVNAIVGASIYAFPGRLAAGLGPASILTFLVCGVLLISVALCFAECASMFDSNGGPYVYAEAAFGSTVAFGVGWACWATSVLSGGAVAAALGDYVGSTQPLLASPAARRMVGALVFVLLSGVNYLGVRPGATTTNVLTVAKLVPLLLLVAIGLWRVRWASLTPFAPLGFSAFGALTFKVLFAVQGFEVAPVPAGETRAPGRTVPLAIVAALLFSTVLYGLIQLVAIGTTPDLAQQLARPIVAVGQHVFASAGGRGARWGEQLFNLGAIVSMVGFLSGIALGTPRYLEALAAHGRLWPSLAAMHARFRTPHVAIVVTAVAVGLAILTLPFDRLVDLANLAVLTQYVSTAVALLVLRRTRPEAARPVRLPGGPWIAVSAVLVSLVFATQAAAPEALLYAVVVASGYGVYLVHLAARRRVRRPAGASSGEAGPAKGAKGGSAGGCPRSAGGL
jgi:amino acid transporter